MDNANQTWQAWARYQSSLAFDQNSLFDDLGVSLISPSLDVSPLLDIKSESVTEVANAAKLMTIKSSSVDSLLSDNTTRSDSRDSQLTVNSNISFSANTQPESEPLRPGEPRYEIEPTFREEAIADTSQADATTKTLLGGYRWGNPATISYSFYNGGGYYGSEVVQSLSTAVINNIRTVLETVIEPLINVNFVEVADSASNYGQLRYMFSNMDNSGSYAYAYYPFDDINPRSGDVHFNPNYENSSVNRFGGSPGNHGYTTIIHETLHALGLKHPGDYNGTGAGTGPFLPYGQDNLSNTVMTYNFAGNSPASMMPYDIKALQYLYGAKANNASDSVYTFNSVNGYALSGTQFGSTSTPMRLSIFDAGGTDTFDLSALASNASGYRFDLTNGGFITTQSAYNGSSYQALSDASGASYQTTSFGTALAYNPLLSPYNSSSFNTLIENLVNSSSNDLIIANSAANKFGGYTAGRFVGSDTIQGTNALDILDLAGYSASNVTQTQSGNNLVLGLGSNGSVTITDYYLAPSSDRINLLFGSTTPTTGNTFTNPNNITIPSSGAATPYPSNITVSGLQGNIANLQVTLNGT
ncbi:MAG TPA: M10 family metallopeptidase [Oculatellaceae cyanobacterium]|jgi:hypothetical protein